MFAIPCWPTIIPTALKRTGIIYPWCGRCFQLYKRVRSSAIPQYTELWKPQFEPQRHCDWQVIMSSSLTFHWKISAHQPRERFYDVSYGFDALQGERAHIERVSSYIRGAKTCSSFCSCSLRGISIKNKALRTLLVEHYLFGPALMPQERCGLGRESWEESCHFGPLWSLGLRLDRLFRGGGCSPRFPV